MSNEKQIIKRLAKNIAQRDVNNLERFVANKSFENALKELNGYNLEVDFSTCQGELLHYNMRFDCNYKSITTTIFQTSNNGCEVYDGGAEVHIDEVNSIQVEF